MRLRHIMLALTFIGGGALPVWGQQASSPVENYYDLGGFHRKVTTDSKAAQT